MHNLGETFQGHRPVGGDCKIASDAGRLDLQQGFQGHRPVGGDCKGKPGNWCSDCSEVSGPSPRRRGLQGRLSRGVGLAGRGFQGHRPVGGDCKR